MWPWKTKAGPDPDLIADLVTRVLTLEKAVKVMDSEWTEMYDKFRRLHMRLAKRDQRAEDAPEGPNGHPAGVGEPEMSLGAKRLLGRL